MGVAQGVQAGVWDTGLLHPAHDRLRDKVRYEERAVRLSKHEIGILVVRAAKAAVFGLLLLLESKRGNRRDSDFELSRFPALGSLHLETSLRLFERLANRLVVVM